MSMRHAAKAAFYGCVNRSGLPRLGPLARRRDRQLVIVGYHGVSLGDEHRCDPPLYIEPAALEARLRLLSRGPFHVLPLAEAVARLYAGTLPPRSVVLTFDDGFHNFYASAFPLLRRYGLPATVYLTTYYCDFQKPIFDVALHYLLWKAEGRLVDLAGVPGWTGPPGPRRIPPEHGRRQLHAALRDGTAHLGGAARDELLQEIALRLGVEERATREARWFHVMNADETAAIAAAGIDVQLHTHRHRTPREPARFAVEIRRNQARIRGITGRDARHFCYPNGFYVPEFVPWLRELSIASATTCDTGCAAAGDEPLLLPRFLDSARISQPEFEAWMYGVGAYFSRTARAAAARAEDARGQLVSAG